MQVGLTSEQKEIFSHLSIEALPDGLGGTAKTIRFTGANVQIVNGIGATNSLNSLGNLIVGYNELIGVGDNRTGSHNIVGGNKNNYTAAGGHIVGEQNTVTSTWASVSGGFRNTASGLYSSVSGGQENTASGDYSSVSGGLSRSAIGIYNWSAGSYVSGN